MKTRLLLPSLFAEQMPDGEQIDTQLLSQWMPAEQAPLPSKLCFEQVLLRLLGVNAEHPGCLPIADCLYLDTPVNHPVCAQPVHLDASHDNARLLPGQCLSLAPEESSELVATLNELWNPDGIHVTAHSAVEWQLTGQDAAALDCLPTSMLAYLSVADALPRSAQAAAWRQLLTEAQMLLHEHPVNISRHKRGLRAVNSIWCFGGAGFPEASQPVRATVFSNDAFAQGLAQRLGIDCGDTNNLDVVAELSQLSEAQESNRDDLVIADTRLQNAWLENNITQFIAERKDIVERILTPINDRYIKTKQLSYQIDDCSGNRFEAAQATGLVAQLKRVFSAWR